ncbi:MAG: amidohydrolase family protein [Thermodesulfobacteriota bacterium]
MKGHARPSDKIVVVAVFSIGLISILAWACTPQGRSARVPKPRFEGEPVYIDVHNHLFAKFPSQGQTVTDYEGAVQNALTQMNELGVRKAIIMPHPFTYNQRDTYVFEDFLSALKPYPDRFGFLGGGGTLNVMLMEAARDGRTSPELRAVFEKRAREILAKGALGFGEMATEHVSFRKDHPYESAPTDHPLLLLLADIAAEAGVPLDLHMEAVPQDMPLPAGLDSPPNPKTLRANIQAFERLLAHNRRAKIIWSHVGWCNTGSRTVELCRRLLAEHPNLYMSFKIRPDSLPQNRPLNKDGQIKPEWVRLVADFPDRFMLGADQFFMPLQLAKQRPRPVEAVYAFVSQLPESLKAKVGYENARQVFKIK